MVEGAARKEPIPLSLKFSYVHFHGKKFIHLDGLIAMLREWVKTAKGNPEKTKIDLEKLADWLETAEYPGEER